MQMGTIDPEMNIRYDFNEPSYGKDQDDCESAAEKSIIRR